MGDKPKTSGVQQLIDRLSEEGVAEGQREAELILGQAQQKANELLDEARREAEQIREQARHDAEQFRQGGEESLKLACRDSVRELASRLHEGFRNRLQELVRHQLKDVDLLRQAILEIAGKARPADDAEIQMLLPPDAVSEQDVRERLQAGDEDALTRFVEQLLGDEVRKGFTVKLADADQTGLRVRVVNENVEIDFTEEALTEFLAEHLMPRFRAVMRK
jgi:V/A-type H+-transporting ATPase subunit E